MGFRELPYVDEVGVSDPQDALLWMGSSEVKMSVCGGGVYVVLGDTREGYNSNVRWKK
tara:strand:+ start:5989 stop:6162 length:174 start_codon:yes stop_codon:yes gene_type:complete